MAFFYKLRYSARLKYAVRLFCVWVNVNRQRLNTRFYLIWIGFAFLGLACSSEKNTITSKVYHNVTAHYNGYWYANEEIRKIEETILRNQVDDYNAVLKLYPTFDSALAKSYDEEIQEAIKMASIAIQRHPNSNWVDDAYIAVGKARLYSLDWGNAIATFKHVNTKSKDKNARHLAIIHLIRTYTEHQEYANAQAAIDYLEKQNLNSTNRKKFGLEKAWYYQQVGDYDKMVRSLTSIDDLLKKRDRKGRIYFIIGQVYQELGFEAEAYNYYRKCLSTNPEYEVDFYARLYMAQVTEISRGRDINSARKSFRKLLKDSKNKEFLDKIHYEMGIFELKQDNINEAIENFNLSVRKGNNKKIDGEAFLRLGEIYYDTLRDYEMSQAYYDSAVNALPSDYEGYETIKARQEILNEFVKHLKTIQLQDSLLSLSRLDSASIRMMVDSVVTAREKARELQAGKKKRRFNRVEIVSSTGSNPFGANEDVTAGVDWYFGNPTAMALGQSEFRRVWGNVPLEDNWRRSQRQSQGPAPTPGQAETAPSADQRQAPAETTDPVAAEFESLFQQVPRTEEARRASLAKIEEAYFRLGDIYYLKLQENQNAIDMYLMLLDRFPETSFEPETLYSLYLITRETDPTASEEYARRLMVKYPESTYAKILINPNYLQESSQAAEKQKVLYKAAYEQFQQKDFAAADSITQAAMALGTTSFTPNLLLFQILLTGETEDVNQYQYELDQFIQEYSDHELAPYAKKLLDASREFHLTQEKRRGIQYIPSFEQSHYYVVVYSAPQKVHEQLTSALESFNKTTFANLDLKTSNLTFNEEYGITFVVDLPDVETAMAYYSSFSEKLSNLMIRGNHKFDNFVITKENFDIFYRTKGLNEYLQFFQKNYTQKVP